MLEGFKLEKVMFSIDKPYDLHYYAKFLYKLSNAVAMGRLKDNVVLCIGGYGGVLGPSFMVSRRDFDGVIMEDFARYLKNQECILLISGDPKQPSMLEDLETGRCTIVGSIKEIVTNFKPFTHTLNTGSTYSLGDTI